MRGSKKLIGLIIVLGFAAAFASAAEPPAAPAADTTAEAPAVAVPMPKMKFFPHIHYPGDLQMKHVEGLVVAHFKIDKHGHAFDGELDFDDASKPFARSVKDFLRSLLFDVPKDWSTSSSPVYDMTIEFVICPHKSIDGAVPGRDTVVVTGCPFDQIPHG